ncbi:MAG: CehA/McbA family metallohydrolase [Myxococcales bacterium]|nr:CehA/McbA family metallohydrolase [Myxococcales bacterium]
MPRRRLLYALLGSGLLVASAATWAYWPSAAKTSGPFASAQASGTRLHVRIFDGTTRTLMPGLVSFRGADKQMVAFGNFADLPGWAQGRSAVELDPEAGLLAFRHGMAVWRGEATIPVGAPWSHLDVGGQTPVQSELVPGIYEVIVSRGATYDTATYTVDLREGKGRVTLDATLVRTVDTTGYVSADVHVHNAPESPDAHANAEQQLKVAAVNGLDVLVSTNHGVLVDLAPVVAKLWKGQHPIQVVTGNEQAGPNSHFGVFPLPLDPGKPGRGAPVVRPFPLEVFFQDLRALEGRPVVVANHPRLGWQAYMDEGFCGGWARKDFGAPPPCPQSYDAFEVLNGWQTCGTRMRDATDTWLALLSYNAISAPVGGSDSHYVSAMVPGYPRTWVRLGDGDSDSPMPTRLAEALRARRTIASTAPFVTLRSGTASEGQLVTHTDDTVPVRVRVQAPNWVPVDTVRLLVNGTPVKTWNLARAGRALDFTTDEALTLDRQDAFVTVETDSQVPLPPHLTGEEDAVVQYGLSRCAPRPGQAPGTPAFAVTSPLFVDRDGDGLFKGPRATTPIKI